MKRAVIGALLALGTAVAQAEIVELKFDTAGRQTLEREIKPKGYLELCGALKPGDAVRWQYEAGAPLDFNIHYHVGKDVVYPAQLKATASAGDRFEAKLAQDYCWMWVNKGPSPTRLRAELLR
jgi:hypothetical protein